MYDFWDYFWSWVLLLSFALPVLIAVVIFVGLKLFGLLLIFTGFAGPIRGRSDVAANKDSEPGEDY